MNQKTKKRSTEEVENDQNGTENENQVGTFLE